MVFNKVYCDFHPLNDLRVYTLLLAHIGEKRTLDELFLLLFIFLLFDQS